MYRIVNVEFELEPGKYIVIFKITGEKDRTAPTKDKVVRKTKKYNRKKFLQIGMICDLAVAKATTEPRDEEVITEMAGRARKREKELAEKLKAEGADLSEHEGAGAIWGGGAGAVSQQGRDVGGWLSKLFSHSITKCGRSSKFGMRASFREGETADEAEEEEAAQAGENEEEEGKGEEREEEEKESDSGGEGDDEENYWDAVGWVGLRVYA